MDLFTVILDFQGGTYIKQIKSASPKSAVIQWAKNLETNDIYGLGPSSKEAVVKEMKDPDNTPVALDGMINTWCTTFSVRGKLGLINIIKTKK